MIDEKDIDRLKEIFVTKESCEKQSEEFCSELNKEAVRLAVIETKLSQITWLLTAVVGGVVTMLVKMFFGS